MIERSWRPSEAILEVSLRYVELNAAMWSWMPSVTIFCDLGGRMEPSCAILKGIFVGLDPSEALWRHLKGHITRC